MKTKFENNWKNKTLEILENKVWEKPNYESYLISTCHELRKKRLNDFEIEDLRIMIGQNIGLEYLIPLALEYLNQNILAEGDYYKGDLLKSVLNSDENYWKSEKENWKKMCSIFEINIDKILSSDISKNLKSYLTQEVWNHDFDQRILRRILK